MIVFLEPNQADEARRLKLPKRERAINLLLRKGILTGFFLRHLSSTLFIKFNRQNQVLWRKNSTPNQDSRAGKQAGQNQKPTLPSTRELIQK